MCANKWQVGENVCSQQRRGSDEGSEDVASRSKGGENGNQ
jgi:hypothetical protein